MYELKNEVLHFADGKKVYEIKVTLDNENKRAEICECINLIMSGQLRKNIEKNDDEVRGLKQTIDRLNADNEKLKKACRTNSEMCINLMRLTNLNPELIKKNEELEKKNAELEEKHWDECRQIAQYDDDLKHVFNEVVSILDSVSAVTANGAKLIRIHENPYKLPTSNADVNCRCSIKPIEKEPSEPENEMTNEEAIQDIQECVKPVCGGKSLDMAVVALKKQVPLKPKSDCVGLPYCPFCCSSIDDDDEFCSDCGQKIDWSDWVNDSEVEEVEDEVQGMEI